MIAEKLEALPDLLKLHRLNPQRYPLLFDSVSKATHNSRFSLLFAFPQHSHRCDSIGQAETWFSDLDQSIAKHSLPANSHDLPFQGGWVCYLSYEFSSAIEPTVGSVQQMPDWPIAEWLRVPAAFIIDWQQDIAWLVVEAEYASLIARMREDYSFALTSESAEEVPISAVIKEEYPQAYLDRISKIKRYIVEGDLFQANISRLWQCAYPQVAPADLYEALSRRNPAPFAVLWDDGKKALISSSPERLFEVSNGRISTRPIAGTHPRDADSQADLLLSQALLNHPKERAEHVMLIDLERNDLGRICQTGSVKVSEFMTLESYQHVHHIVSCVEGLLSTGIKFSEIIQALFPGGTITGCPKVRCMQVINELEAAPRGPYTGSIGYISRHGRADFNILIRSMWRTGNTLQFRTGSGIVSDSVADNELEETRHKARGMIRVFE